MLDVRIDFCESLCMQLCHSVSVTVSEVKYWLHRMRWQSCMGPGLHPPSLRRSQKTNAKEVWARPKQTGMHICRKAFAGTGHSPDIISGHICLTRTSRLQGKWVCFLGLLEDFPAGKARGAGQACLGQLTFYVWRPPAIPGLQSVWF